MRTLIEGIGVKFQGRAVLESLGSLHRSVVVDYVMILSVLVACSSLLLARPAAAQSGTIIDVGAGLAPPSSPGYVVTFRPESIFVTGINDSRDVVGWHQFGIDYTIDGNAYSSFANRSYIWRDGTATDIGGLQNDFRIHTTAADINNDGDIVGTSQVIVTDDQGYIDFYYHAYIWNGGMTDLMPAGLPEPVQMAGSAALGINNQRHVTGSVGVFAHRWIGSAATDLEVRSNQYRSFATAVNDSGIVVGASYTNDLEYDGFMYRDGQGVTDLGSLVDQECCSDMNQTYPNDINQAGTIVGWAKEYPSKEAFIWENGVGRRLRFDPYATNGGEALAINNAGQIVGRSQQFRSATSRAYIWLPLGDGQYQTVNLNEILPTNSPWVLLDAVDINENGDVVGHGLLNGQMRPYLLETGFGLTVNSTGDAPDANDTNGNGIIDLGEAGNSVCDTGATILLANGSSAPECTLRAALTETNAKSGPENILFKIDGPGPFVISPQSPLPRIIDGVTIDGFSQPGSFPNSARNEFDGVVLVELRGRLLPEDSTSFAGLDIVSAGSEIRGLIISGFPGAGIALRGAAATGNSIHGNRIGLRGSTIDDLSNPAPDSGNGLHGILIQGAPANLIGGGLRAARNIISGNGASGIHIEGPTATNNLVLGNFIGTDSTGTQDTGNRRHGIAIVDAPQNAIGSATSSIRNVIAGNDSVGIYISGASATGNSVEGNYVGIDGKGEASLANASDGILLRDAPGNTIGGSDAGSRNVVSGNGRNGVKIIGDAATGNKVNSNFIGTNAAGAKRVGNGESGVRIDSSSATIIGGDDPRDGNVIAGNGGDGIRLEGSGATGTIIRRNVIGASESGSIGIGNVGDGVSILNAPQTIVGGLEPGHGNFIAANSVAGIGIRGIGAAGTLVQGNNIGADSSNGTRRGNQFGIVIDKSSGNTIGGEDPAASNYISHQLLDAVWIVAGSGNRVLGNSILKNAGLPINLDGDETAATRDLVTPNDDLDADDGANQLQNFPELRIIGASSTDVLGTLKTQASGTYRIELFGNSEDAEGENYLGSMDVTTDENGLGEFVFPAGPDAGTVTATATDAAGNTSEFSVFPAQYTDADLEIAKSVYPRVGAAGDTVRFSIQVHNNGPHPATNVSVVDLLPAGLSFVSSSVLSGDYNSGSGLWDIGDVAIGDTLTLVIAARLAGSGSVKNTATVMAGDQVDLDPTNDMASAVVNAVSSDLSVTNVVNPLVSGPGGTVTYTITVANSGPANSVGAQVANSPPVGITYTNVVTSRGAYDAATDVWTVGALDSSQTASMVITARVDSAGKHVNIATVSSTDERDPDGSNNTATAILNDDGSTTAAVLRVIHSISNVSHDTVDVYLGDVLAFDDLAFRESREIATLGEGEVTLAVAPRSSVSVSDTVFSDTIRLAAGQTQVAILFDEPPAGITLVVAPNVPLLSRNPAKVDVSFYNGVPDAPPVDIRIVEGLSGDGPLVRGNVAPATQAGGFLEFDPVPYTFEFLVASPGQPGFAEGDVVASIVVNLFEHRGASTALVLSGLFDAPAGFESSHTVNATVMGNDGSRSDLGSPVAIENVGAGPLPDGVTLGQNYPNPFSGTTAIRFSLSQSGPVSVDVFDVLGQRVLVVAEDETTLAGWHEVRVDLSGLAAGPYLYRLRAGDYSTSRLMLLVR